MLSSTVQVSPVSPSLFLSAGLPLTSIKREIKRREMTTGNSGVILALSPSDNPSGK